jgi:hypothetical protein
MGRRRCCAGTSGKLKWVIGELVFLLKTFFSVFLGISMARRFVVAPAFVIIGLLLLVRFVMVRFAPGKPLAAPPMAR